MNSNSVENLGYTLNEKEISAKAECGMEKRAFYSTFEELTGELNSQIEALLELLASFEKGVK